jgi:hypothetical protein
VTAVLLDLFITHWTEPWEVVRPGLEILKLQRHVDWEQIRVTIVHDGTEAFPDEWFSGYPFQVFQAELPHGGIAAARNWCIDHSDAEWIKWNDCDDMFANIYALFDLTHAMEIGKQCDMLWFDLRASLLDGRVFTKTDRDPVLIHGKAFRRSFLKEHGIRYNEELTWCEDSAFLALVEMEIDTKRIGHIKCDSPIYAWICRQGSLCNRPEIKFDNLKSFFKRHCYVQEEMQKHGYMDEYYAMTVRVIGDSYYTLHRAGFGPEKEGYLEHRQQVVAYYKKHREDLLKIPGDRMMAVVNAVNHENPGCDLTREELVGFLNELRELARGPGDVCI